MLEKDIKTAYCLTPDFQNAITGTLNLLDESAPVVFAKRRKRIKISLVFVLIFLILSTSVVGASTEFFGLLSRRVGNYGLNISVESPTEIETKTSSKGVTLDLRYLPDGYVEPYGDDVAKNVYEYYQSNEIVNIRTLYIPGVKYELTESPKDRSLGDLFFVADNTKGFWQIPPWKMALPSKLPKSP